MPSINRTARATTGDATRLTPVPLAPPDPSTLPPYAGPAAGGWAITRRTAMNGTQGWVGGGCGEGEGLLASESTAPGACPRTDGRTRKSAHDGN